MPPLAIGVYFTVIIKNLSPVIQGNGRLVKDPSNGKLLSKMLLCSAQFSKGDDGVVEITYFSDSFTDKSANFNCGVGSEFGSFH